MSLKKLIISTVKIFYLKKIVIKMLQNLARRFPKKLVTRNGLKYDLDLRETIDFAIYFHVWEPETHRFLAEHVHPGDTVIEVGANFGAHTLQIAAHCMPDGMVYAFEPTAYAFRKLERNLELNPNLKANVAINYRYVTDLDRTQSVSPVRSSYGLDNVPLVEDSIIPIELSISIDEFVRSNNIKGIELLKIDVDGSELSVLRGAREAISEFRPLVYIELDEALQKSSGGCTEDILNFFDERGYKGVSAASGEHVYDLVSLKRMFEKHSHLNIIFKPTRN